MSMLRISDIIECRHVTSILVCLYMRGDMGKTDLYRAVSTNPRMGQKLDMLTEHGLVRFDREGRRTVVRLTECGKAVAEGLCRLERILYGSVGDPGRLTEGTLPIEDARGWEEADRFIPRVDSFHDRPRGLSVCSVRLP